MNDPLSPAAQAVEDAYFNADGFGYRNGLATALRAAVDLVNGGQDMEEALFCYKTISNYVLNSTYNKPAATTNEV